MVVVVHVPQAVLNHGVHQLLVAHARAPTGVRCDKGSGGHVLRAAADHHVGVPGQNGACTFNDRLHTGAADHAHGVGGNGIGDAGLDGHLTGNVLAKARGQDAAEHNLVHLLGLHARAVQGFLNHDGSKVGGGNALQGSAKRTDGCTAAIHDIKFFHDVPPFFK
ncbi:hypothetical protein SDC9_127774 [bioreactor metagenome]|uniref:Uncharacterized protein n=1 Tax=bioreactor metagenome TaxID=1076179 RepID=A0A645CUZ9_9ZZZZ